MVFTPLLDSVLEWIWDPIVLDLNTLSNSWTNKVKEINFWINLKVVFWTHNKMLLTLMISEENTMKNNSTIVKKKIWVKIMNLKRKDAWLLDGNSKPLLNVNLIKLQEVLKSIHVSNNSKMKPTQQKIVGNFKSPLENIKSLFKLSIKKMFSELNLKLTR